MLCIFTCFMDDSFIDLCLHVDEMHLFSHLRLVRYMIRWLPLVNMEVCASENI